jgi:metal-responsive CopG/Arc/MetJ family transcriptional regulator
MMEDLPIACVAVADMIRDQLVEHRQNHGDCDIAGAITLIYDHHKQRARKFGNETILASLVEQTI